MISKDKLFDLLERWPVKLKPEFRGFTCVSCGKIIQKAWHIHYIGNGKRRELHLCKKCGLIYNLK